MSSLGWAALLALGAAVAQQPVATPAAAPEVIVETAQGTFTIRLRPDLAPRHVRLFLETVAKRGYDGTTFHRIIPAGIIQGGDPLSRDPKRSTRYGTGGLGLLPAEFSDRPMLRGVVAAVRRPSSKDSAGNQFFVCLSDQLALNGQYTIFGEVVEGMPVVDAIGATPVAGDRATVRVEMKVRLRAVAP